MKFDFHDILIEPCEISSISSRKEIDCYYTFDKKTLPIFVAPMDTVVDGNNYIKYLDLGMNVCFPRGVKPLEFHKNTEDIKGKYFTSYGLDELLLLMKEIESYKLEYPGRNSIKSFIPMCVLIDIANGHMSKLLDTVIQFKTNFPNHILMVGNVANPSTFRILSDAGADYIRVGIGNGGGCLTSQQTGIGFPSASLIAECYDIKEIFGLKAKIVADGGFKNYSDIIKALALGADYVMLGSILNKALESSGDSYWKGIKVPKRLVNFLYKHDFKLKKKFRGMSTKEVQKAWGRTDLKTSEGVIRYFDIEYTLEKWTRNLTDYLKSAMSYTDSRNLTAFIGKVKYNLISTEAYKRFNK